MMGQYNERKKAKRRLISDHKIKEKFLSLQVTELYNSGIKQSSGLIKFDRELKKKEEKELYFSTISSFNPNNLAAKDNEQLFSLLVLDRAGNQVDNAKYYSEFIKSLLLLSNIKGLIFEHFSDLKAKSLDYVNNFKVHSNNVTRTMEEFQTAAIQNNTINNDVLLNNYYNIIQHLKQDTKYKDIYNLHSRLISPMYSLCLDEQVRGDPRINIILKEIMLAKSYFENYEYLKSIYGKEYCNMARKINSNVIIAQKYFNSLIINNLK